MHESQATEIAQLNLQIGAQAARISSDIEITQAAVDTRQALLKLASKDNWDRDDSAKLSFIGKRLDISSKLHVGYHSNGTRKGFAILNDYPWLHLATWLFLKHALLVEFRGSGDSSESPPNQATTLATRRYNVAFKALDGLQSADRIDEIEPDEVAAHAKLADALHSGWDSLSAKILSAPDAPESELLLSPGAQELSTTHTLPITMLFYEGPIARAYLAIMKSMNLRPRKLVELVAANDVVSNKPVGRWLPSGLRNRYASSIQRSKIHYWPKQIRKDHPQLVSASQSATGNAFGISSSTFEDALTLGSLESLSDNYSVLPITGLKDPALLELVRKSSKETFLYTGGGIVPEKLLTVSDSKFLHIHPGFLPDVRGADCTLWSSLISGHCAATCFYMAPGIDTGDIIRARWLPKLDIGVALQTLAEAVDTQTLYRAIYAFIDPWVRAAVLRDLLIHSRNDLYNADSYPQDEEAGTTYHFMHDRLRAVATKALFRTAEKQ